jgi:RNA recognition motif-containing protein
VRYLPNHWNDNQLYDLFSLCGNVVKSHIPRDPYGFSRGYGFILFSSEADAAHSLHKLNDFVIENHKLLVKYAYKPMPPHLLTGR